MDCSLFKLLIEADLGSDLLLDTFKEQYSVLEVDSEDGSAILVLDLSVAAGHSHEGASGLDLALLGVWDVGFELLEEGDGFWVLVGKLVGELFLLDLAHLGVHVEGALSDWDDAFDDVPEDALVAWSGREGARVGPSLVEVEPLHELLEVQLGEVSGGLLLDEPKEEAVVPLDVGLRVSELHLLEELLGHDFEEEAEDTGHELGVLVLRLLVEKVDDVHFQVEELAVDGVLTWGVEMELDTMERGGWDVLVEERDGLRLQAVGVLLSGLALGDVDEEGVTGLVELELLLVLSNLVVVELEVLVLEVLEHLEVGAQVDWGLLLAELAHSGGADFLGLNLQLWTEHEVDSWSLGERVLVALGEVVLEGMCVLLLAAGTAESHALGGFLGWLGASLLVGVVLEVDVSEGEGAGLLDLLLRPLDVGRVKRVASSSFLHALGGVSP